MADAWGCDTAGTVNGGSGNDAWGNDGGAGGFGAGGGGGGGRGGGGDCRKCGEPGHFARECPQGGGGGGGDCRKCGEPGHFARECPQGGGGGARPKTCRTCNEEGHIARDCPQGGGDARSSGVCFGCGEEGHTRRDCPSGGGDGAGRGGGECFNCKQPGHISKDCPEPPAPRTTPDGKPLERYEPEEVQVNEALFDMHIGAGINFANFQNIPVEVTGSDVARINTFDESGLDPRLLANVTRAEYTTPTPIQAVAMPIIMAGQDVMGCAQTGSGKTAAFVLPILDNILKDPPLNNTEGIPYQTPQAIIVAPTRELASQIGIEFKKFSVQLGPGAPRTVVVYGGVIVAAQRGDLIRGANIVVGTPGRLNSFIDDGTIDLSEVRFFVLDEADRMLDMGFEGAIKTIGDNKHLPKDRTTLMFSATFPRAIQMLARKYLRPQYAFVTIGVVGGANTDVTQTIIETSRSDKKKELLNLLESIPPTEKVMVFVETKKGADFVCTFVCAKGHNATSIHGDRLQRERETALREFKSGQRNVLVATSVAARGLDIPAVAVVVNFDLPKDVDEYVHRIGRTGRVGNTGRAISFFDPESNFDSELGPALVQILVQANQEVPDFLQGYGGAAGGGGGAFGGNDMRGGAAAEDDAW